MSGTDVMVAKLKRLSSNPTPTVLDLFAGCGGFSLGFQRAGFRLLGAIEMDDHAARSHAANFFRGDERHAVPHDITSLDPLEFVRSLAPGQDPRQAVDILIGGPPCQAFARIGRAKLREVHEHPEAFQIDPRVGLYESYLHYVRELRPVALVMENVIDILNHAGRNIPEEICGILEGLGYNCRYTTLNAVHYGVAVAAPPAPCGTGRAGTRPPSARGRGGPVHAPADAPGPLRRRGPAGPAPPSR